MLRLRRWRPFPLLLLAAPSLAGTPVADDGFSVPPLKKSQLRNLHSQADGDRDGKLTLPEIFDYSTHMRLKIAKSDVPTMMDELDQDKDGFVTRDEFIADIEAWETSSVGQKNTPPQITEAKRELELAKFAAADEDGDTRLGPDELPAIFYPETKQRVLELVVTYTLKEKDYDKDGYLTPREFWGDDASGNEHPKHFRALDTDGDGKLNHSELAHWESGDYFTHEALHGFFGRADVDGDGHLTVDEMVASGDALVGTDAHHHLAEWAEHEDL